MSFVPETPAETFARVPGKDVPNLAASVVGVQIGKKHNEGELEIAVLACGPRIAVPVMQDDSLENGSPSNFQSHFSSHFGWQASCRTRIPDMVDVPVPRESAIAFSG